MFHSPVGFGFGTELRRPRFFIGLRVSPHLSRVVVAPGASWHPPTHTSDTIQSNPMLASMRRRCGGVIGMFLILFVIGLHLVWVASTDNVPVRQRECPQDAPRVPPYRARPPARPPSTVSYRQCWCSPRWMKNCAHYDALSCPTAWLADFCRS